jgi:hypothetical protein
MEARKGIFKLQLQEIEFESIFQLYLQFKFVASKKTEAFTRNGDGGKVKSLYQ